MNVNVILRLIQYSLP